MARLLAANFSPTKQFMTYQVAERSLKYLLQKEIPAPLSTGFKKLHKMNKLDPNTVSVMFWVQLTLDINIFNI